MRAGLVGLFDQSISSVLLCQRFGSGSLLLQM